MTVSDIARSLKLERVSVIKIDTQGYEAKVFAGMKDALQLWPDVRIFMEFWPWGIRRVGDDPSALLRAIGDAGFQIELIDGDRKRRVPIATPAEAASLLALRHEREYVDFLLTPRNGSAA